MLEAAADLCATPLLLAQQTGSEMLLDKDNLASAGLLCLGILLITAWLLMRLRKKQKQGPGHPTAQEQIERYRQHDGVKNDLESIMVDIEQLAKRLGAQLDAKAIALEQRINEADLRIAQLHDAMRQEHSVANSTTNNTPPKPRAEPSPRGKAADIPVPDIDRKAPPPNTLPTDPLTMNVYRLADEGTPPAVIAQQLNEHVGKIELILALRQK